MGERVVRRRGESGGLAESGQHGVVRFRADTHGDGDVEKRAGAESRSKRP